MAIIKQQFTITYEREVNTDTGEIIKTSIVKTSDTSSKSSKKEIPKDTEPKLILEDTKFKLNDAALDLMQIESGCKLDIKYEKNGTKMIPVIGSDDIWGTKSGNKLSKTNTVICKGIKHDELAKFGNVFIIEKHSSKDGLFILKGDKQPEELKGDENISSEDIDLSDLIDDTDEITEIDSNFFKL